MAGTIKRFAGPAFMAAAAADILAAPAATLVNTIRHIHVANVTGVAASFTLYLGATGGSAAGTELFKTKSVAANDTYDWYCALAQKSTDFLSGLASAGSTITITVQGDQSVVP